MLLLFAINELPCSISCSILSAPAYKRLHVFMFRQLFVNCFGTRRIGLRKIHATRTSVRWMCVRLTFKTRHCFFVHVRYDIILLHFSMPRAAIKSDEKRTLYLKCPKVLKRTRHSLYLETSCVCAWSADTRCKQYFHRKCSLYTILVFDCCLYLIMHSKYRANTKWSMHTNGKTPSKC